MVFSVGQLIQVVEVSRATLSRVVACLILNVGLYGLQ